MQCSAREVPAQGRTPGDECGEEGERECTRWMWLGKQQQREDTRPLTHWLPAASQDRQDHCGCVAARRVRWSGARGAQRRQGHSESQPDQRRSAAGRAHRVSVRCQTIRITVVLRGEECSSIRAHRSPRCVLLCSERAEWTHVHSIGPLCSAVHSAQSVVMSRLKGSGREGRNVGNIGVRHG